MFIKPSGGRHLPGSGLRFFKNHAMKKKNLILIALLVSATQVLAQKANTVVTGKLKGLPPSEWIYIDNMSGGERDSVTHKNGKFRYEKYIPEGEGGFYIFRVGKSYDNANFIFLEKGKLHIKGDTPSLRNAKYAGGNLAEYYNLSTNRPGVEGMAELQQQITVARQNGDTEELKKLSAKKDAKQAEQKELDKSFVLNHKDSPAVAYAIFFSLRGRDNWDELEAIISQLSPAAKNNLPIKDIEHSIRTEKLTGIGRTALDFSQTDTAGKVVSLRDFRGKYVLIDFWASWCVPCRVENPNVVAAHEQYKNKNFTVLGISFDNPGQHDRWIQAIHDDNLHWTQLSDLKGWKNEVGQLYDIRSIPSSLLIDPDGVIVAKNLKGEKLDEKLWELLGEPRLDPETFMIKGRVENPGQADRFYIRYDDGQGSTVSEEVRIFNGVFSYLGKLQGPAQVTGYFAKGSGAGIPPAGQQVRFEAGPGIFTLTGTTDAPSAITVSKK